MKKVLSCVLAFAMAASMSLTVFAAERDMVDARRPGGTITLTDDSLAQPRLSKTTKDKTLSEYWSQLYVDGNFFDQQVEIQNRNSNPGDIYVKIEVEDQDGPKFVVDESDAIPPKYTWTSETIPGSYKKYRVYVKCDPGKSGTYKITYDDI